MFRNILEDWLMYSLISQTDDCYNEHFQKAVSSAKVL